MFQLQSRERSMPARVRARETPRVSNGLLRGPRFHYPGDRETRKLPRALSHSAPAEGIFMGERACLSDRPVTRGRARIESVPPPPVPAAGLATRGGLDTREARAFSMRAIEIADKSRRAQRPKR